MTYTCQDLASSMEWTVEQYITREMAIKYVPSQFNVNDTGTHPMNRSGLFFAQLQNIMRIDNTVANMTVNLTIVTGGVHNGTTIVCTTARGLNILESHALLYFSG